MSVNHLIEKGFSVTTKDIILKLYDCNQKMIIQFDHGSNKTFKVNLETTKTKCLSAEGAKGDSKLWRKRLGHLNFRSLGHLSSKKLVHEISKIVKHGKSCEICIKGKKPSFPFASEVAPREKHVLGVIHSDVCGPLEVPYVICLQVHKNDMGNTH